MSKYIKLSVLTICLYAMTSVSFAAERNTGARGAQFLNIPIGARSTGMGNAFSAYTTDVNSVFWNPAGMVYATSPEAIFQHIEYVEDQNLEYGAFVHPNPFPGTMFEGSYGVGITYYNEGSFDRYTLTSGANNQKLGTFSGSAWQLTGSYARRWLPWLSAGVSLKWVHEKIDSYSGGAFSSDIGARFMTPYPGLFGSFVIQNAGTGLTLNKESFSLPLTFRIGGAYKGYDDRVGIDLDLFKPLDDPFAVAVGAEFWPYPMLAVRVGYDSSKDLGPGVMGGAGIKYNNFSIDYAYTPFGDLQGVHRISGQYRFGGYYNPYASSSSSKEKQIQKRVKKSKGGPPAIRRTAPPSIKKTKLKPSPVKSVQRSAGKKVVSAAGRVQQDYYDKGMDAFIENDYENTIKYLLKTSPPPSSEGEYYTALGVSYFSTGDIDNARKNLKKAAAKNPRDKTIKSLLELLE